MSSMTPQEIVLELDKYIIGQTKAKRAVAIALRNRWRRMQITGELQQEITPKNILMIGPTGVGKTEISRRLAKLAAAPFIKVEATKFTEVGYVGKDVDAIIRDLTEISVKMVRQECVDKMRIRAESVAYDRIIDVLVPQPKPTFANVASDTTEKSEESVSRKYFRNRLKNRDDELWEKEIEINLALPQMGVEIMAPPGMEEMTNQLQSLFQNMAGQKTKARRLKIKEAFLLLIEEEANKMVNNEEIKQQAIIKVEQHGIVFIDEIDKICRRGQMSNSDVSREGVQRDLLPLIEGCSVSTKYGPVKTDHILFIASGSFQAAQPSDLIPELQGRLPIQVALKALTKADFEHILTQPKACLTKQYVALMGTEGLTIEFTDKAVEAIALKAFEANQQIENIGARRLHTILEQLMEDLFFTANYQVNKVIKIDDNYVNDCLNKYIKHQDLTRAIL